MSYYNKSISGANNGKFDSLTINNTSRKLPIDVNGKQLNLEHILPKQTIASESSSYYSLLLPKVHIKQKDILLVDESGNLNMIVLLLKKRK